MTDTLRIVKASDRSPGLTEISRDGRSFSIASASAQAQAELREHVDRVMGKGSK